MGAPATCVRCHTAHDACLRIADAPYCPRCRRALASDRGLAFFFDAVLPLIVLNLSVTNLGAVPETFSLPAAVVAIVVYVGWLTYFLVKDALGSGRSLAKRWRGLRVLTLERQPCTHWQSIVRNAILIIPVVVWVEVVVMLARADGRRLGDLMARTVVVAAEEGSWR